MSYPNPCNKAGLLVDAVSRILSMCAPPYVFPVFLLESIHFL